MKIQLPEGSTHLTVGYDERGSKMSPEQKIAMDSLNAEAKKRHAKRQAAEFTTPLIPKEEPMETVIETPAVDAIVPTADEAAKTIPGPDACLPDPLEKKAEIRSTVQRGPVTLPGIEAEEEARTRQVTNSLRYTQETLAVEMRRVFDEEIMALRAAGQKEYAHDADSPFANFERGAKDMGIDRKQVLWCYAMKHKDGIAAALQGHTSQREDVRGRINDLIVYLLLMRGIFNEEAGNTGNFGLGELSE